MDGVHGILDAGYLPVHAHRPATSHAGERNLFAQVFDDAARHTVGVVILRLPPFVTPVDTVKRFPHVRVETAVSDDAAKLILPKLQPRIQRGSGLTTHGIPLALGQPVGERFRVHPTRQLRA